MGVGVNMYTLAPVWVLLYPPSHERTYAHTHIRTYARTFQTRQPRENIALISLGTLGITGGGRRAPTPTSAAATGSTGGGPPRSYSTPRSWSCSCSCCCSGSSSSDVVVGLCEHFVESSGLGLGLVSTVEGVRGREGGVSGCVSGWVS